MEGERGQVADRGAGVSTTRRRGTLLHMNAAIAIVIAVVVIVAIVAIVRASRRRKEVQMDARRREATETRDLAKVSQLEADRRTAEAEERAAARSERASRPSSRSWRRRRIVRTPRTCRARADDIDPDV